MSRFARYLILLIVLCILLPPIAIVHPGAVVAATSATSYAFTVNATADTHDAHPGDGVCEDSNGHCSLRAAIEEGDALPQGSNITITVPAGKYKLKLGTLRLTAYRSITMNGAGNNATIIKGNNTFTVLSIGSPRMSAHLSQLTIEGGNSGNSNGNGGGIDNEGGTLSMSNSTVSGNSAAHGSGGGIYNNQYGTLSVSNSAFSNNSAQYYGGGIFNFNTLSISNSTFSGNSANVHGGGIYAGGTVIVSNSTFSNNTVIYGNGGGGVYNTGTLSVSSSTFSGNSVTGSGGSGGGIDNYTGTLSVSNSTFSGNSASVSGGGIDNYGGRVTLTGTIVANSTPDNCNMPVTDNGYNLDSGASCGFTMFPLNNTDPMLGPLGKNGGPTQTMALWQGSKAIDWVAATSCPATDQRGHTRPDNGEVKCDIGAYESSY